MLNSLRLILSLPDAVDTLSPLLSQSRAITGERELVGLFDLVHISLADARLAIEIEEAAIPISEGVAGACELLGPDPLYVACEGRMIVLLPEKIADLALAVLRSHPLGAAAARIGTVGAGPSGLVSLRTQLGTRRVLDLQAGEQLPRICWSRRRQATSDYAR